jgi:hypothetical protein
VYHSVDEEQMKLPGTQGR